MHPVLLYHWTFREPSAASHGLSAGQPASQLGTGASRTGPGGVILTCLELIFKINLKTTYLFLTSIQSLNPVRRIKKFLGQTFNYYPN